MRTAHEPPVAVVSAPADGGRSTGPLTLADVASLPEPCRGCVRWELGDEGHEAATARGDSAFEKEAWLSRTLLEWGAAGRVAHEHGALAGFLTYAPPAYVPRSTAMPTSPVSADAVLLMTGGVLPGHRGTGLGRVLVQGAAKDLTQRGVRAVEAFAAAAADEGRPTGAGDGRRPGAPVADPLGVPSARLGGGCLLPAGLLLEVGFEVVRDHPEVPRLRLELRTALGWREDVERALDRILADVRVPALR